MQTIRKEVEQCPRLRGMAVLPTDKYGQIRPPPLRLVSLFSLGEEKEIKIERGVESPFSGVIWGEKDK